MHGSASRVLKAGKSAPGRGCRVMEARGFGRGLGSNFLLYEERIMGFRQSPPGSCVVPCGSLDGDSLPPSLFHHPPSHPSIHSRPSIRLAVDRPALGFRYRCTSALFGFGSSPAGLGVAGRGDPCRSLLSFHCQTWNLGRDVVTPVALFIRLSSHYALLLTVSSPLVLSCRG